MISELRDDELYQASVNALDSLFAHAGSYDRSDCTH